VRIRSLALELHVWVEGSGEGTF